MNKELFKKDMGGAEIASVECKSESAIINLGVLNGGTLEISSYHQQDCCESVYADMSVLKYHQESLKGKELQQISIKGVESMGFLLCLYFGYDDNEKIFIPCYNSQNGYYSDNLELVIKHEGVETKIDLQGFIEANIN